MKNILKIGLIALLVLINTAITKTALAAPTINSFTATVISSSQIDLVWSVSGTVDHYNLYDNDNGPLLTSSLDTSFSYTNLQELTYYSFALQACADADEIDCERAYADADETPAISNPTPPVISVITPVATPTKINTPEYIFTTDKPGLITYGGDCSSETAVAAEGDNAIILKSFAGEVYGPLADKEYNNCTITVTEVPSNVSNLLTINTFTVDTAEPTSQNIVFASSASKKGGDPVTVVSAGETGGAIWFAPSWTTDFFADATMTTASGVATSILAPITPGAYKLFVIDAAGNISAESVAILTVLSSAKDITSFIFTSPAVTGTIDNTAHTVALTVPYGTNITAIAPTIAVSANAAVSPLTGAAQNFTNPVIYTVTAEDSTTQNYTVTVTVAAAVIPVAPSGLSATTASASGISLAWTDNSDNETGFKIYRDGSLIATTSANATSYSDAGLAAGTSYSYYIKATNADGDSAASNTASATTSSSGGGGGGGGGYTPPASSVINPSISINTGAVSTNNPAVILTIGATNAIKMAISNNADFSGAVWETYAVSKNWTLTAGDGVKTVYIKFQDASGYSSAVISDTITLGAAAAVVYPDGAIVKSSAAPEVYVIKNGQKEWIKTAEEFIAGGYKWENVKTITSSELAAIPNYGSVAPAPSPAPLPGNGFSDGTLIKISDSFRVYVIISQKKKWISTPEVFETLGYKWGNIAIVSKADLDKIPDYEDNLIRTIGDYKVYLVVNGLRHHIPNPEIFLDYGFGWGDVKDVPAETVNKYPMARLIRESKQGKIYYLSLSEVKKWVPTAEIFNSYNNKWADIQVISQKEMASYAESNIMRYGGKLYLIEGLYKRLIPSDAIFKKNKYNSALILDANKTEFDWYKTGAAVK